MKTINNDSIIELVNLSKTFNPGTKLELNIIKNINLKFYQALSYSITGKSGTGKSTLLQIIGGLDEPTEGKVLVRGQDYSNLNDNQKSKIRNQKFGYIFQNNLLLEDFNVLENVMMPFLIFGKKKEDCLERAKSLLDRVGLIPKINKMPNILSGGEKQRVSVCRSLINKPELILADEPTGSLDEENAKIIEDLLFSLVREERVSLLLVTHNKEFADKADKKYILRNRGLEYEE
ncbi:MAG: ABC transporter ATP-binding protein [Sphaerochaetaceae bacterium]|nr:ABC transporter ATP-binding protein [Sphaerochaetaceae bacterium]